MSLENRSNQRFCQHAGARGRRCRMLVAPAPENPSGEPQPQFCAYDLARNHAKAPLPDPDTVARELLRGVAGFSDAASVNRFLGNLLRQLARRRISRRDAIALAYVSQLLINTLNPLRKDREDKLDAESGRILAQYMAQIRQAREAQKNSNAGGNLPGFSS